MRTPPSVACALVVLFVVATQAQAPSTDWSQWRGPDRDGRALAFTPPADWPKALVRFQEIARYEIADSPTWAHAALSGRQIVVKDADSLTTWTLPASGDTPRSR